MPLDVVATENIQYALAERFHGRPVDALHTLMGQERPDAEGFIAVAGIESIEWLIIQAVQDIAASEGVEDQNDALGGDPLPPLPHRTPRGRSAGEGDGRFYRPGLIIRARPTKSLRDGVRAGQAAAACLPCKRPEWVVRDQAFHGRFGDAGGDHLRQEGLEKVVVGPGVPPPGWAGSYQPWSWLRRICRSKPASMARWIRSM